MGILGHFEDGQLTLIKSDHDFLRGWVFGSRGSFIGIFKESRLNQMDFQRFLQSLGITDKRTLVKRFLTFDAIPLTFIFLKSLFKIVLEWVECFLRRFISKMQIQWWKTNKLFRFFNKRILNKKNYYNVLLWWRSREPVTVWNQ